MKRIYSEKATLLSRRLVMMGASKLFMSNLLHRRDKSAYALEDLLLAIDRRMLSRRAAAGSWCMSLYLNQLQGVERLTTETAQ
jgi:hypothetical protein